MGSLLMSGILIYSIITFYNEDIEDNKKFIALGISLLFIIIISLICKLNIMLYIISSLIVGLSLRDKIFTSRKIFLFITCVCTFISINIWGFFSTYVLCFHFDYGLFKGIYQGFTSMNSSYEFTFELINELILKYGHSDISSKLHLLQEQLYPELNKIDILKTFLDLLEYL